MLNRTAILFVALAAILGFALGGSFVWSFQSPPQTTHHASTDKHADQAGIENSKKTESLWIPTDSVGLYTLVLAVFTGLLVAVSGFQGYFLLRADKTARISAEAARASTALAREEFIATHRPRMRIKHIWMVDRMAWRLSQPLEVNLDIVNIGDAIAYVTWINYQTLILPTGERLPQRPPYDEVPDGLDIRISRFPTSAAIPSGVTLYRVVCDGILDEQDVVDILWGRKRLYLIGTVEYVHGTGLRQTAFCRRLTYTGYPPPAGDLGRFEVENDPDYEYED
jgi:hypothetical protein